MTAYSAGWYPDPHTGSMRYFDGERWLDIPAPPPALPVLAAPQAVPQVMASGPNHALHFILSVLTCGFWVIPWLFIALGNKKTYQSIDADGIVRTLRSPQAATERHLAIGIAVGLGMFLFVGQDHVGTVIGFIGVVALFAFAIRYAVQRLSK